MISLLCQTFPFMHTSLHFTLKTLQLQICLKCSLGNLFFFNSSDGSLLSDVTWFCNVKYFIADLNSFFVHFVGTYAELWNTIAHSLLMWRFMDFFWSCSIKLLDLFTKCYAFYTINVKTNAPFFCDLYWLSINAACRCPRFFSTSTSCQCVDLKMSTSSVSMWKAKQTVINCVQSKCQMDQSGEELSHFWFSSFEHDWHGSMQYLPLTNTNQSHHYVMEHCMWGDGCYQSSPARKIKKNTERHVQTGNNCWQPGVLLPWWSQVEFW